MESARERAGLRWTTGWLGAPVKSLLQRLSAIGLRYLDSCDPLTRLPGRRAVAHNIRHRLSRRRAFVAIYWGLDNLAPFSARHGLREGDQLIRRAAEHLRHHFDGPQIFTGQTGPEDFVTLLEADENWEVRLRAVLAAFEEAATGSFNATERRRKGFLSRQPTGDFVLTPLTSLVAGVVKVAPHRRHTTASLLRSLDQVRQRARAQDGPGYFIDRRDPWYLRPDGYR